MGAIDVELRALGPDDIPAVQDFPPREWNLDLGEVLRLHLGRAYFRALLACRGGLPVGIANGFANGRVGWLGNLIVREGERRRGIGARLTAGMLALLAGSGCESALLVATSLGEPIYRKLGFETVSRYVIYRGEPIAPGAAAGCIRPVEPADHAPILAMDLELTGESRGPLLSGFLRRGFVYQRARGQPVLGYYLPSLGAGPILARTEDAGSALLAHKHALVGGLALVPEPNEAARRFLTAHGYVELDSVPRLQRGAAVRWQPAAIFARGAGYLG